jgi:UDP-N-acetylglucosamine:LPS N-acetylglucosamine transferase
MSKKAAKTRKVKQKKSRLKLCLACSAGGHLAEMLHLRVCYSKYPHFFITFKKADASDLVKREKVYFVTNPARGFISFIKCAIQSFKILSKEKPDVVISTGAGVALPTCYLAKLLFKSKIIFLESFCRIENPSLSGRLAYPISDLFFVQWPDMLKKYGDKALYKGAIV